MIAEGRNLVLTGMMGTGKSRVGRLLAAALGREFADTDALVEEREGRSIADLFAHQGEPYFRRVELEVCRELGRRRDLVIATGGGALVHEAGRQALGWNGLVICLRGDPKTLAQRVLQDEETRPLLLGRDPEEALAALWRARRNAYALAPLQITTDGHTPEEVCQAILEALRPSPERLTQVPVSVPGGAGYTVWLGAGALHLTPQMVPSPKSRLAALVWDDRVPESLPEAVRQAWEKAGCQVVPIPLRATEEGKTLETTAALYQRFLEARLDRGSLVLILGGGVTTDLAGFAAATFMRGLPTFTLPTTLLGAVDASVGGKTGVNLPQGKNLVGVVWPPAAVAVDPVAFYTLPDEEIRAGLAETVKAGLIGSPALFAHLEEQGLEDLPWIVAEAVRVKAHIVSEDPYERGPRAYLNLGHTFGHALEVLSGYRLPHGQAVAMGMVAASRLGEVLGLVDAAFTARLVALMEALGLPTRPPDIPFEDLWQAMHADKKQRAGRLRFVVPAGIGKVCLRDDVTDAQVREAWERSKAP
ncbi:MAG: 3-dehydroquinate synthase [Anaerolineae bacterium]